MRHIPEDELHAYLDQGLSRIQCVEIESHLAVCPSCRATRDGIAALRDRTTALLAALAPARTHIPRFDAVRGRAAEEASARQRRIHLAAWAASVVLAVALGWSASHLTARRAPAPLASVPATGNAAPAMASSKTPAPAGSLAMEPPPRQARPAPGKAVPAAPMSPAAPVRDSEATQAALAVLNQAPELELSRIEPPREAIDVQLDGMWRTMSWDGAQAEAGSRVPKIDGLPVVQVQFQAGELGKRPLMVVAQQLSSGQVIRTIEGPAADVSHLLARQALTDSGGPILPGDSTGAVPDTDHAMAMQVGDRMLAITGALPSDSLRAMIRRLNAEMRGK